MAKDEKIIKLDDIRRRQRKGPPPSPVSESEAEAAKVRLRSKVHKHDSKGPFVPSDLSELSIDELRAELQQLVEWAEEDLRKRRASP